MKSILQKCLALLAGLLFTLLLLEASLRVLGAVHATRANRDRLRDDAAGTSTILCLGDSFTYGCGAAAQDSYPAQLERLLNAPYRAPKYRVLNLGVPAQNTAQVLDDLPADLRRYKPAAVVFLAGTANNWNYTYFYRYLHAPSWRSRLQDALYGIRVFRLHKLLKENLAVRRCPAGSIDDICARAEQDFVQGRGDLSTDLLLKADKAFPQNHKILFQLGINAQYDGRIDEAVALFERGMAAAPDDPENRCFQSLASLMMDKPDDSPFVAELTRKLLAYEGRTGRTTPQYGLIKTIGREKGARSRQVQAWILYDVRALVRECRRRGVTVVLQSYPNPFNQTYENRVLSEAARRENAAFVDQTKTFAPLFASGKAAGYFVPDGHCNAAGYGLMAAALKEKLGELGFR